MIYKVYSIIELNKCCVDEISNEDARRSECSNLMTLTSDLINKGETLSQQNQEEAVVAQIEDPAEEEAASRKK